jgi:hypothetical protein
VIALLLGFLLVGAASCCTAALLRPAGRVAFLLGCWVLAFAEIVAVSHGLSFVDAYERRWFLVVAVLLAAAASVAVVLVRPPWPSFRLGATAREIVGDRVVAALAVVVALELVYVAALAIVTPPNDTDTLTYHLMRGALWIQQHSVSPVGDARDPRIDEFQPDADIVQALTMLLSGSARYAQLVAFSALLAATAAIYGVAMRVGFGRRSAAFGALLFPTLPVVALQAPTAMTDIVVAAFVVIAALFVLGRRPAELGLACVAVALLIGTKVSGILALPLLLAIAVLTLRGRRLWVALAGGLLACLVGGAWFAVNLSAGEGALGSLGEGSKGTGHGVTPIVARVTRYTVQLFELPGATGRDALLYVVAAAAVAIVGVVLRRWTLAVVGAVLTALPLVALPVENVLHRAYWRGWNLLGQDRAIEWDADRDQTIASSTNSWYGPVGLALAVVALVLVAREVRRRTLPPVAAVLVAAPPVMLVGSAVAVGFNSGNGRYVMGGVALSAATWGVVRTSRTAAVAIVAVTATTLLLSLVNYEEKPAGVRLLRTPARESIWTMPAEWAQNLQPELVPITRAIRERARPGETIALTRDPLVRPFIYAGWPRLVHHLEYADSLAEAAEVGAAWAVLPDDVECEDGWQLEVRSPPWAVYRQVPGTSCR